MADATDTTSPSRRGVMFYGSAAVAAAVLVGNPSAIFDPAHAAVAAYEMARHAYEAINPADDDALELFDGNTLYAKEEALAQTVPTTRAGAEKMADIILKVNDSFVGSDTIEMLVRSLVAAIPA